MSNPYGGSSYGSSSAGQSAPSAPGAPGAPSSPGGPSYPGGPLGGSGSSSEKNGVGLWAMILGLGGILFGLLTGLPGAIMGMIGLKNVKNGEADNKGQALTGLIAGILTSIGGLIGGVIVIVLIATGALFSGGLSTIEPTSPQTQGGQEPGGSGGSRGGNSSGKSPEIDNGVNLAVRSKQVKAGPNAIPYSVQNKEYMFIEVSVKNNSDSNYSLQYPLIRAYLGGKQLFRVTDVETQKKGLPDWPTSIGPGEEAVYHTGFEVAGADAKNAKVTVSIGGKKYDFTNS